MNIVVADDQSFIRKGIKLILQKSGLAIDNIFLCANGQEVLDLLEKTEIDLIITDIRMPQIDGLELMEICAQRDKRIKIIILSGYNEFSYAKEAIKYGAKQYILKPADRDELLSSVQNVIEQIENEKKQIDPSFEEALRLSAYDRIRLLLSDREATDEDELLINQYIDTADGIYISVIFDYNRLTNEFGSGHIGKDFLIVSLSDHLVAITKDLETLDLIPAELKLKDHYAIGISDEKCNVAGFKGAHMRALEAAAYHYVTDDTIIRYSSIQNLKSPPASGIEEFKLALKHLETGEIDKIRTAVNQTFDKSRFAGYDISFLARTAQQAYDYIMQILDSIAQKSSLQDIQEYSQLRNIFNYPDLEMYKKHLYEFLLLVNQYYLKFKEAYKENKDMEKAVLFIKENYDKNINLAVVSNYVSLNYSYFSHVFKQYTGKSFIEYLRHVRIEASKKFIAQSDLKFYEIAHKVGFENSKHFTRAFREIVGITPQGYRQSILKDLYNKG